MTEYNYSISLWVKELFRTIRYFIGTENSGKKYYFYLDKNNCDFDVEYMSPELDEHNGILKDLIYKFEYVDINLFPFYNRELIKRSGYNDILEEISIVLVCNSIKFQIKATYETDYSNYSISRDNNLYQNIEIVINDLNVIRVVEEEENNSYVTIEGIILHKSICSTLIDFIIYLLSNIEIFSYQNVNNDFLNRYPDFYGNYLDDFMTCMYELDDITNFNKYNKVKSARRFY